MSRTRRYQQTGHLTSTRLGSTLPWGRWTWLAGALANKLWGVHMGTRIRSLGLAIFAVLTVALLAVVPSVAPQMVLAATTTALIMGGAGHSLGTPPDSLSFVTGYLDNRVTNYVIPSGTTPTKTVAVITPEARILGFGFDPAFTFQGIFDGPFDPAVADGSAESGRVHPWQRRLRLQPAGVDWWCARSR